METLPQEMINLIVWLADRDTRSQLLTVSRRFQAAVEMYTWRTYRWLLNDNMEDFLAMYHGHRSRFLRYITIDMKFPTLQHTEDKPLLCRETVDELHANNELITRQISGLFAALKILEKRESPNHQPRGVTLHIVTPYQLDNNMQHCDHRRYHSWRLRLLNPQTLPNLSCIRTLSFANEFGKHGGSDFSCRYERPLDMGMVAHLMHKLPNLEILDCYYIYERFPWYYNDTVLRHFAHPWEGPWRDSRHAFGKAIDATTLPARIKSVKLHFGSHMSLGSNMDQSIAIPNLTKPLPFDPLSSGLRVLSYRLTKLDLRVCADSNLFWPSSQEKEEGEEITPPSWPYLKHLSVEFKPSSPSGTWYFQGPRGEGRHAVGYQVTEDSYPPLDENEADERWDEIWNYEGGRYENSDPNMFRVVPIDETIEPFLEAFAKALSNMPLLEEADLFTLLTWEPRDDPGDEDPDIEIRTNYRWGVKYLVNCGVPRLEWQVGRWRPSNALHQHFHNLGRYHKDGKPLEEQWIDS